MQLYFFLFLLGWGQQKYQKIVYKLNNNKTQRGWREAPPPWGAAEGGASPATARHQLEGPGGNFLPRPRHANNAAFSPALVTALQGLTHDLHIANALKAVVHPAPGHGHDFPHHVIDLRGI